VTNNIDTTSVNDKIVEINNLDQIAKLSKEKLEKFKNLKSGSTKTEDVDYYTLLLNRTKKINYVNKYEKILKCKHLWETRPCPNPRYSSEYCTVCATEKKEFLRLICEHKRYSIENNFKRCQDCLSLI